MLKQKMARDRLKEFQDGGFLAATGVISFDQFNRAESRLCFTIGRSLSAAQ